MSLPTGHPKEFTLARVEIKKGLPAKDGQKAAVIYRLGLIGPEGEKGWAEMFVREGGQVPSEGTKETLTLTEPANPDWALSATRPRTGGGGRRSPEETKAIQRQHSQEMAIRLFAASEPLNDGRTAKTYLPVIKELTDWFERDIRG